MNPLVLFGGGILFSGCLLLHVLIWRIRMPRNDVRMLSMLFLALPLSVLLGAAIVPEFSCRGRYLTDLELMELFLLHAALAGVYIASYPAAQAHSPSLAIMRIIAASPEGKMTGENIVKRFTSRETVIERVEDLSVYDLVSVKEGMMRLRPLGGIIIRLYLFYRRLLALPPGKG